jgi:hypothetical protein
MVSNYQKIWYQNDQNSIQNYTRNSLAVKYLCQINNVKLIEKDSFNNLLKVPGMTESARSIERARDLEHPGILSHKLCADIFLNSI